MTRMMPSSSSSVAICRLPLRAARSAASLIRLARSAPANPGLRPAGPAAQAGAAGARDGIGLVHEDDARRVLLGLLEQVANAAGAHADEHLDEVGARDREEGHARLTGDSARQQRLARAGRPEQ